MHETTARKISALGAGFVALGIVFGAFGAHALKDLLDEHFMNIYEKAVFYHIVNSLGLVGLGLICFAKLLPERRAGQIALLLSAGIVIFSGSLYLYSTTRQTYWAMTTPVGGALLIIGWITMSVSIAAGSESPAR